MGIHRDRASNVVLLLKFKVEAVQGHPELVPDFAGDLLLVLEVGNLNADVSL